MLGDLPLHPMAVHLPLALAGLAPLVVLAALVWRRRVPETRSWILVVLVLGLLAASAFAAKQTGEREEDRAEEVVSGRVIHEHEEAGERMVLAAIVVAAISVVPLVVQWSPVPGIARGLTFVGTFVVLAAAIQTGHAGAELVYRHGAAAAYVSSPDAPASSAVETDDD